MDAVGLLAEARAAGLRVEATGGVLVVRGPRSAEPLVRRLQAAKPELLRVLAPSQAPPLRHGAPGFVEAVSRLLGLPLASFAEAGRVLEVRVPWLDQALYFAPDEPAAERLVAEGVSRGCVWTARELADLIGTPGITRDQVRTVAHAKNELAGEVAEVRTLGRPGVAKGLSEPPP